MIRMIPVVSAIATIVIGLGVGVYVLIWDRNRRKSNVHYVGEDYPE